MLYAASGFVQFSHLKIAVQRDFLSGLEMDMRPVLNSTSGLKSPVWENGSLDRKPKGNSLQDVIQKRYQN